MFGKLNQMGDLTKVIGAAMRGDKSGIVAMLKPEIPGILTTTISAIIQAGGGYPATDAAFLWLHTRRDGTTTIMATIYRRTDLDEPGELVGTIDVFAALDTLDLSAFIQ